MSNILTSSEAARLCGVSFRTVIRWIQQGKLQAYRLPGRGDHRVPIVELRRFMQANAIPEPPELQRDIARRILVIEDEPNVARAMERALTHAGFETATTSHGLQAGLMLHFYRPGLMILNICAPGVDGPGALRILRENPLPFACKVLVVSTDTQDLEEMLAQGADAVLAKPFSNAALLDAIGRLYGEK